MRKFITKKQEKGIVQEDLASNVKLVLEYVSDIAKRQPVIDKMAEDMQEMKSDISVLKTVSKMHTEILMEHGKKLDEHGKTLDEHSKKLSAIQETLNNKPSREETKTLDHRLTRLEAKIA